jgi:glutathione S-transferase
MLKIWGRADGSNVIKAMWCVGELGIEHERIDWGGEFGGNDDAEYRRKNPNGRLPTLEEDDGWTLWESGAVVRYLCMKHSLGNLCPETPRARAEAEKWMDWSSLNFAGFNSVYLQNYFGPKEKRSPDAIVKAAKAQVQWLDILERHLEHRQFLCGEKFTMGDIPAGSLTHRWFHWTPKSALPTHANVRAWYERLASRPAFKKHVIEVNAKRTQEIAVQG